MSSKILDSYIKELDFNKMNFTADDLASFEKFRYELDDQLKGGDLSAAYQIYNVYRKRAKERFAFVTSLLNKPMDFKTDEIYTPDREKSSWAKSATDLDDISTRVCGEKCGCASILDLECSSRGCLFVEDIETTLRFGLARKDSTRTYVTDRCCAR